jgi:hypothetical protein
MPKKVEIKITRLGDDLTHIEKDENLVHLISIGYGFHKKVIELVAEKGFKYENGDEFVIILSKLSPIINDAALFKNYEIIMLRRWIDCVCQMLLDIDGVDYKDKDIRKFFKLAKDFVDKTREYNDESQDK